MVKALNRWELDLTKISVFLEEYSEGRGATGVEGMQTSSSNDRPEHLNWVSGALGRWKGREG